MFTSRARATLTLLLFTLGARTLVDVPVNAARHGGAAFMLAYGIMWALLVVPMTELHSALGRAHSCGVLGVLPRTPLARGVGWSFIAFLALTLATNGVPAGHSLYYITLMKQSVSSKKLLINLRVNS